MGSEKGPRSWENQMLSWYHMHIYIELHSWVSLYKWVVCQISMLCVIVELGVKMYSAVLYAIMCKICFCWNSTLQYVTLTFFNMISHIFVVVLVYAPLWNTNMQVTEYLLRVKDGTKLFFFYFSFGVLRNYVALIYNIRRENNYFSLFGYDN